MDRTVTEARLGQIAAWGHQEQLGELDTLMWRTERHPANSWTGLVLLTFDATPDWVRLQKALRWLLRLAPRFRERVIEPVAPVGVPVWSPDPAFEWDYHLRRVRLPGPGSVSQLLTYAQAVGLTPLDRGRSPWTGTLVEGLEGGRAAFLLQAHHVLMDGMAVTQLLTRALSAEREPARIERSAEVRALLDTALPTPASPMQVTGRELLRQVATAPRFVETVAGGVRRSVTSPLRSARYARSLLRVLTPTPPVESLLLKGGSRRVWRFGMLECELGGFRAAGKSVGGSVNDTFVAVLLGGIRDYCAERGEVIGDLPISMPVSMRTVGEAMGGNKFAGAFFEVPAGIADPTERIREIHRRVDRVRSEPALDFLGSLTPVLNRVPSAIAAGLLGAVNSRSVLTTSSWPGVPAEMYAAGVKVDRMFVFAPLPGTSLTGAMCTHAGTCCIAINVDGEVFLEPDRLWHHMQVNLDQVLALAA
jgi:diacylglycerol O-acyltransferase